MRLAFISLLVFSFSLVAWVVFGPAPQAVPSALIIGVVTIVISLGLWELDRRIAALESRTAVREEQYETLLDPEITPGGPPPS